jgi:hypothetical protein
MARLPSKHRRLEQGGEFLGRGLLVIEYGGDEAVRRLGVDRVQEGEAVGIIIAFRLEPTWKARGSTIIANVGDQDTDLALGPMLNGHSRCPTHIP